MPRTCRTRAQLLGSERSTTSCSLNIPRIHLFCHAPFLGGARNHYLHFLLLYDDNDRRVEWGNIIIHWNLTFGFEIPWSAVLGAARREIQIEIVEVSFNAEATCFLADLVLRTSSGRTRDHQSPPPPGAIITIRRTQNENGTFI